MKVEQSLGEIIDKLTILSIKKEKITDKDKLDNVTKEFDYLINLVDQEYGIKETDQFFVELKAVNQKLWDIEDGVRLKEAKQEFDEEFIKLARSVYYTNEDRLRIKKEINVKFKSYFCEEKEYAKY